MKKLLSVLLLCAMLTCLFASCDLGNAARVIAKADQALQEAPYTVTMSMDFTCEDETLNQIFDALSMEIPVTVDGENLSMKMSTEVMGMTTAMEITVVDKVLYYNATILNQSMKMKASLSEEDYKAFIEDNNSEMPVDSASFETVTMETVDGKKVITCTGITNDGLTAMNQLLSDTLTALGAESTVSDLSFVMTVADGKYESMALTATYSVTVSGKTHTVSLSMNAKYSYENVSAIVAPSDADSYKDVSYGEIMGD